MAVVNVSTFVNGKDSSWLQLEVCREFQRNKCSRSDLECKFAHPPPNIEVQNGRVTACYDSIKGRCNRDNPPCKYFHPPQHLKDQLLINGRNHLAFKNAVMQQIGMAPAQAIVPGQIPATATLAASPYIATAIPQIGNAFSPYFAPGHLVHTVIGPDPSAPIGVIPQTVTVTQQQKIQRSERLEGFPGVVSYKRTADKAGGVQIYPANASTYQQLMQLQQPFVPVSFAGHPPGIPRF